MPRGKYNNQRVVYKAVLEITKGRKDVEFEIKEVKELISQKYPDFNLRSVESRMIKDSVNHDSHKHHPPVASYYWKSGRGKYRLY